jgi:hypothetical protein
MRANLISRFGLVTLAYIVAYYAGANNLKRYRVSNPPPQKDITSNYKHNNYELRIFIAILGPPQCTTVVIIIC